MKKILVIGSTVVDVIINLDRLPAHTEDVHVLSQTMSLGGCAFNASQAIHLFEAPYTLFTPIGQGIYGRYVREHLEERGITSPIPAPTDENGCCYCFVESTGERTFVCYHGAEYLFYPEWFDLLNVDEIESVYICGLEIEETTGENVIAFLEKNPQLPVFFAPGPRMNIIPKERLTRLFALHPVIHLNDTEVCEYIGCDSPFEAADKLRAITGNTVIVTLGEKGAYYTTAEESGLVESVSASVVDTIGAGDSHIGSIMACLAKGDPLPEAIRKANLFSAAVVEQSGALLPKDVFDKLNLL